MTKLKKKIKKSKDKSSKSNLSGTNVSNNIAFDTRIVAIGLAVAAGLVYVRAFENEFFKDIIMIAIPSLIVLFASNWVSNQWQIRKAKIANKKELLNGYVNSIKRPIMLIDMFVYQVQMSYSLPGSLHYKETGAVTRTVDFDATDTPDKRFKDEFERLNTQLAKIRFESNLFLTSSRLYLRDESLEEEYNLLHNKIGHLRTILYDIMDSKTKDDLIENMKKYRENFKLIKSKIKDFEKKLVLIRIKDVLV